MMIRPTLKRKWYPPENKIRLMSSRLVRSNYFEYFILFCITANAVVLSMLSPQMTNRG